MKLNPESCGCTGCGICCGMMMLVYCYSWWWYGGSEWWPWRWQHLLFIQWCYSAFGSCWHQGVDLLFSWFNCRMNVLRSVLFNVAEVVWDIISLLFYNTFTCIAEMCNCNFMPLTFLCRYWWRPAFVTPLHCWGLIPTTSRSCLCHEHITNLLTGVSRLLVLDCGTIFHPGFGGRDSSSILLDDLRKHIFLATEAPSDSFDL